MAPYSKAVKALGIYSCQLCHKPGSEENPLTRHHCNHDSRDHSLGNVMVVHRWYCHTFADFIAQMFKTMGWEATPLATVKAWDMLIADRWLFKILIRYR